MPRQQSLKGSAAIITVVIVAAAALLMTVSATQLGMGDMEISYQSQKSGEAFAIADGCVEEALRRLRTDQAYTGATLNLGAGSCIISVSGGGATRTISVSSAVGNFNASIQAAISISANIITVTGWQRQ
jgi:hypothetical protein